MEENEKILCPECGEEMQEFYGKYFCLACGNEYEEKVDDSGEKSIVLVSGNPLRDNKKDNDIQDDTLDLFDKDESTDLDADDFYTEEIERDNGNMVRSTIIGVLAGIILFVIVIFCVTMFEGCSKQEDNNDNSIVYEQISYEKDNEQSAAQEDEEKTDENEDEPTPTSTATPTPTPTVKPTVTPTPTATIKPTAVPHDAQNGTLYRVRKSADDATTQLGAFRNLDSAKALAKDKKAEGYKVYDQDGRLIYKP